MFNFLRKCHTIFHRVCTIFTFLNSTSSQTLLFFILAILTGVRWCLTVVLICIFLMISEAEHLSMCLLVICTFSLEKYLSSFPIFESVLFVVVVEFRCSLCILDINSSAIWLANTFFLFHGLPFCFVSYFFCSVQKLFSLVCFPLPVLLVSYQKSYCHGLCQDFPCFLLRAFQFQVLHSSSPLSTGLWFKICSECLKPQIVSNSIYAMFLPIHRCL